LKYSNYYTEVRLPAKQRSTPRLQITVAISRLAKTRLFSLYFDLMRAKVADEKIGCIFEAFWKSGCLELAAYEKKFSRVALSWIYASTCLMETQEHCCTL